MKMYNEENKKIIREFYGKISDKELAEKIGAKDPRTIERFTKRMGIWERKKLTKEDNDFIYANRFELTPKEMSKIIGTSRSNISSILRKMGFYKNNDNYVWDDEKIKILKENYEYGNMDEMMKLLNADNPSIIFGKARKLKLNRKINFTQEEEIFLIDSYNYMSLEEISKHLKKDIDKVKRKAMIMGLDNDYCHWSEEEILILKENYSLYPNSVLKEKFFPNFSVKRIGCKAETFGLKKECNHDKFDKKEITTQLRNVYDLLGRTPTIYELKSCGLPSSATFKKYFGGYSNACILTGIPVNSSDVFTRKSSAFLSKNNDICYSASEVIITNFLCDNNISYKKEIFYKHLMNDKRCKNLRLDWLLLDNTIIEFFGLKSKKYNETIKIKLDICNDNNFNIIAIYPNDLNKLNRIFEKYLLI